MGGRAALMQVKKGQNGRAAGKAGWTRFFLARLRQV
jgi:hypothetical protein